MSLLIIHDGSETGIHVASLAKLFSKNVYAGSTTIKQAKTDSEIFSALHGSEDDAVIVFNPSYYSEVYDVAKPFFEADSDLPFVSKTWVSFKDIYDKAKGVNYVSRADNLMLGVVAALQQDPHMHNLDELSVDKQDVVRNIVGLYGNTTFNEDVYYNMFTVQQLARIMEPETAINMITHARPADNEKMVKHIIKSLFNQEKDYVEKKMATTDAGSAMVNSTLVRFQMVVADAHKKRLAQYMLAKNADVAIVLEEKSDFINAMVYTAADSEVKAGAFAKLLGQYNNPNADTAFLRINARTQTQAFSQALEGNEVSL